MFQVTIAVIISYLLGSIPFAILITGIVKGVDVRDYGSKNAGATNVYRVAGLPTALTVALLDLAKGFAAVFWIATLFNSSGLPSPLQLQIICALAAIGGHMFTLFAGFKGGKGVLTAAGAFLALMPLEVGLAFGLFLIILILTRFVSLGSISAALFLSLFIFFEKFILSKTIAAELLILSSIISLTVVIAHKSNISRLLSGTENKIGKRKDVA
jgi:glycerol-3-phosphate acyltransferase PlsY